MCTWYRLWNQVVLAVVVVFVRWIWAHPVSESVPAQMIGLPVWPPVCLQWSVCSAHWLHRVCVCVWVSGACRHIPAVPALQALSLSLSFCIRKSMWRRVAALWCCLVRPLATAGTACCRQQHCGHHQRVGKQCEQSLPPALSTRAADDDADGAAVAATDAHFLSVWSVAHLFSSAWHTWWRQCRQCLSFSRQDHAPLKHVQKRDF